MLLLQKLTPKELLSCLFVIISLNVFGQGTLLLRQPSVSKQHIVFVNGDDLWVVPREGGDARRLTSAMGAENNPRISPDGKWVAFTGQYDGNTDVYLVPIDGGELLRLDIEDHNNQVFIVLI